MRLLRFLTLTLVLLYFNLLDLQGINQSPAFMIEVSVKEYPNQPITLAHYFGDAIVVDTTIMINSDGYGAFKGDTKLKEGIYFLVLEGRTDYVDFLVGIDQFFSINLLFNAEKNVEELSFENSIENDILLEYKGFMQRKNVEIYTAETKLDMAINAKDSSVFIHQLSLIDDEIQNYRQGIVKKHSASLIGVLLQALQEPIVPDNLKHPLNLEDSLAKELFIRQHFWDGVNFWDGRLAYTPFFGPKLDKYFSEIIENHSDSVTKAIDWIMSTAVANEDMEKIILGKLLYGSIYHEYKWNESVFIHLYENYIAPKSYPWMNAELHKIVTDYAYILMGNNKGAEAYKITLANENGLPKSLHDVNGKYTLLCFWDVTCNHCIESLPEIDSLYRTKWKAIGLEVYAVSVESSSDRDEWKKFIDENNLNNFTNVYYSGVSNTLISETANLVELYNVWYFPSFYLLDSEKRFMAKKLNYNQVSELIDTLVPD